MAVPVAVRTIFAFLFLLGAPGAWGEDIAPPVLAQTEQESPLSIPAWDGPQDGLLAGAVAAYQRGRLGNAAKEAKALLDDANTVPASREAAQTLLDRIEEIGRRRLQAAGAAFEQGDFGTAASVWETTRTQFTSLHPIGREASERYQSLMRDRTLRARAEAQQLLRAASQADTEGNHARALQTLRRAERACAGLPEQAACERMLRRLEAGLAAREPCFPFGTVTQRERTSGDLDCKGDCRTLVQGGYMKFDLGLHAPGTRFRSATLRFHVNANQRDPWLWVTLLSRDPTLAEPADLFREIQAHAAVVSQVQKAPPGNWVTFQLNERALAAVHEAVDHPCAEDRWLAMALAFE